MKRNAYYSQRVLVGNELLEATVITQSDKIDEIIIGKYSKGVDDFYNCEGDVIMPGLIDSHVHINEPGRSEWEGFWTATQAAAAGGITTIIDMPLNSSPVTTTVSALNEKIKSATDQCFINVGFWGGVIPGNENYIEDLLNQGVFGLKAFLAPSGIDDFPNSDRNDLVKALQIIKKFNRPLLVHCELVNQQTELAKQLKLSPTHYRAFLVSRPDQWEIDAVQLMIDLCSLYDSPVHIVHVSSSKALELIRSAKREKLKITAETCPHYLFFNAEEIDDGDTLLKCAPPIRSADNNQLLWQGIREGSLDFIVTDHSPAPPNLKSIEEGSFEKAWGGISSLQFSLSAVWTHGQTEGLTITEISRLMSSQVAEFLGLSISKGKLAKGYDADITIWNPEETFIVNAKDILNRHPISPYIGKRLAGVVKKTIMGGEIVYDGQIRGRPHGKLLMKDMTR